MFKFRRAKTREPSWSSKEKLPLKRRILRISTADGDGSFSGKRSSVVGSGSLVGTWVEGTEAVSADLALWDGATVDDFGFSVGGAERGGSGIAEKGGGSFAGKCQRPSWA